MSLPSTGRITGPGPGLEYTPAPTPSSFDPGASFHSLLSQGVKDLFSPSEEDEESEEE